MSRTPKQALLNFLRISSPVHFKRERGSSKVEFQLPGLTYDDFDRTGNLSIWKIFRLMELMVMSGIEDQLRESQYEDGGVFYVMLGQRCAISPKFYREATINTSFLVVFYHCHIGRKSLSLKVEMKSLKTGETLVTSVQTFATLSNETRTSQPTPTRFHEMNPSLFSAVKPPPLPVYTLPHAGTYFKWSVRVAPSDMDQLFHVNQSVYVRYCMDGLAVACKNGFMAQIKDDPCFWNVANIWTNNSGENFAGDELDVCTWECPDEKNVFKFLIFNTKEPTKPVFHCWVQLRKSIVHKL